MGKVSSGDKGSVTHGFVKQISPPLFHQTKGPHIAYAWRFMHRVMTGWSRLVACNPMTRKWRNSDGSRRKAFLSIMGAEFRLELQPKQSLSYIISVQKKITRSGLFGHRVMQMATLSRIGYSPLFGTEIKVLLRSRLMRCMTRKPCHKLAFTSPKQVPPVVLGLTAGKVGLCTLKLVSNLASGFYVPTQLVLVNT